ncbi:unnamed protein product, partial [Ectocarpus fasciculatus]
AKGGCCHSFTAVWRKSTGHGWSFCRGIVECEIRSSGVRNFAMFVLSSPPLRPLASDSRQGCKRGLCTMFGFGRKLLRLESECVRPTHDFFSIVGVDASI